MLRITFGRHENRLWSVANTAVNTQDSREDSRDESNDSKNGDKLIFPIHDDYPPRSVLISRFPTDELISMTGHAEVTTA